MSKVALKSAPGRHLGAVVGIQVDAHVLCCERADGTRATGLLVAPLPRCAGLPG